MLVLVVLATLAPALSIARLTVEGMASPRHASARPPKDAVVKPLDRFIPLGRTRSNLGLSDQKATPKDAEAGHRRIEALGRKRQIDEAWRVFNSLEGEADVRAHASMLDALARVGRAEVRSRPTV